MKAGSIQTFDDVLNLRAVVQLETPAHGFWDGGAKSHFEFAPQVERTPGPRAIRWGSWEANLWFVVEFKNPKQHLAALRRKLGGKLPRKITISPKS